MEEFNFNLLRISIIQILKAQGFDKIKPSTLNVLTNLYIQYFKKLINETVKFAQLRNDEPITMDILQAMVQLGLIKVPLNTLVGNGTKDIYNTKSLDGFKDWLDSTSFQTTKQVNQVPLNFKQIIYENRSSDNSNNIAKSIDFEEEENKEFENLDINWLNYLIEKDIKFGKNKFNNTIFYPENLSEYLVEGGGVMNEYLPTNISDRD
ncbi:hypothetical protein CLIB1444_07S04368 [[Candida] jaroonii]|uniref:Uncharacterized protein n=1 Tax=[Candida] jaroonii TaxID=467808 RepID=A0ACA9Y9Z1_9ASCO|nr:hypothetical protein CLIB1444_07S04368 [[Candida] jaroonii]